MGRTSIAENQVKNASASRSQASPAKVYLGQNEWGASLFLGCLRSINRTIIGIEREAMQNYSNIKT